MSIVSCETLFHTEGTFNSSPMKHLTRTTIASLGTGLILGLTVSQAFAALKGSAIFQDVPASHFANDVIGEMVSLGIMKGVDATHFSPNEPVTRAQMAVLLKRLRDELKSTGALPTSSSSRSVSSSSATQSSSNTSVASSTSSATSSSSTTSSSPTLTTAECSPGGCVHFASREYNIDKNDATGLVTILIARVGGNQGGGTVDYAFNTGTAVIDKDYKPLTGTLTFNSKETSKKIQLQIINNTSDIANRSVNLVLSKPTGALKIDSPNPILLNINDTRLKSSSSTAGVNASSSSSAAATQVSLSATSYAVMENGKQLTITVQRSGVTTGQTDVQYSTANGSGQSGVDFTSTSGTLSFAAGETSKAFIIPISDNTTVDGSHSFTVNLSSPTNGAGLDIAVSTVTINDNESFTNGSGSLKFSQGVYTVLESSGRAKIIVNRVGGTGPASVGYSTNGGGLALAGTDYTAVSGTLSFAQGEASKVFYVPIVADGATEGEETINLILSSPTGATFGDPSAAVIKIND